METSSLILPTNQDNEEDTNSAMDNLQKSLNNISLYDVKAYVRKAQNVVYNYTEMEAKVREATNNEPWGASSTLMQKIAAGTYNYREREEIVGMIFRRFTEKASNEWRQIYKSLQLLEYLIKNGSERLVDDARSNLSIIQMLRSFHYIDSKGRDQGINVRTKAKTLIELLNNDSALRSERKKSRENAKKFQGVAGGISSSGAQDDDDYGTYENRIFGDGGVYGQRFEETRATGKKEFEEYDVDGESSAPPARRASTRRTSNTSKPVPAKPQPQADLFAFDEPTSSTNNNNENNDDEFDEFGDFQTSVQPSAPQSNITNNLSNLYAQNNQPQQQHADDSFGDFTSFVSSGPASSSAFPATTSTSTYPTSTSSFTTGPSVTAPKQDAFSSLFQSASTQAHFQPKPTQTTSYSTPTTNYNNTYNSPPQHQRTASTNNNNTNNNNNNNNNGEINLLDL